MVKLKDRTKKPIWAIKNKYFPLKFTLRVIQNKLSSTDEKAISLVSLRNDIRELAFSMRRVLKHLDEEMGNMRGEKFATGFPVDDDSFDRFFENFVIFVTSNRNIVMGMPYELGFIDMIDEGIVLTEDGNNFANLYSPIIDGYLREKIMPNSLFSDEELNFLYKHIKEKVVSETILFKFILSQINKGINTPEKLNDAILPFLEENFPKENGYTTKFANSIRAGVISRMVELKLIKIEKIEGRSFYKLTNFSKVFMEV